MGAGVKPPKKVRLPVSGREVDVDLHPGAEAFADARVRRTHLCLYRGDEPLRDEAGRPLTVRCDGCASLFKDQVCYPCHHPARAGGPPATVLVCRGCNHYLPRAGGLAVRQKIVAPAAAADAPGALPGGAARAGDPACGVVLGSYGGLAGLLELQVKIVRHTCGDAVPVLVADDASDGAERIEALEQKYPGVTAWVSPDRVGHMGGDLSVFWKGVRWARSLGLAYLAKVSQRFLILKPRWLQDAALALAADGAAVGSCPCTDQGNPLFIRSELVLLDVARWSEPDLMEGLRPREIGGVTELHLWHLVHTHLGERMWHWPLLQPDRYAPCEGTVWHCTHLPDAYARLAARFGVTLDPHFSTDGWPSIEAGRYRNG